MVGEAGGPTVLDVSSRRTIRGEDRDAQVITGEQSGEIGRAPNVATSGWIAAFYDEIHPHERGPHRTDRASKGAWPIHVVDSLEVGRGEVHGASASKRDRQSANAGVERGRGEGHRVGRHRRQLVFVELEKVETPTPFARVGHWTKGS